MIDPKTKSFSKSDDGGRLGGKHSDTAAADAPRQQRQKLESDHVIHILNGFQRSRGSHSSPAGGRARLKLNDQGRIKIKEIK